MDMYLIGSYLYKVNNGYSSLLIQLCGNFQYEFPHSSNRRALSILSVTFATFHIKHSRYFVYLVYPKSVHYRRKKDQYTMEGVTIQFS